MKTKIQKKDELKMLQDKLPKANITIFTTFAREGEKGLSVGQIQELKRSLRQNKSEYVTAKKTLIDIALKGLKYDGIDVYGMKGSIGMIMGGENTYIAAKSIYDFSKKNPGVQFFGAILDGKFIAKEEVLVMATMPSREVLLSRLFGMMKYPISSLAMVLKQIADKKGESAPAPAAAPAPVAA